MIAQPGDLLDDVLEDWKTVQGFHALTTWHEACLPEVRSTPPVVRDQLGTLALPALRPTPGVDLTDALQMRFSNRSFNGEAASLEQLSQVLGTALSQVEFHRFPSAGALYVTRFYVVALRVNDLPCAIYEYLPGTHALRRLALEPFPALELARMLGSADLSTPPGPGAASFLVMLSADLPGIIERYGKRGYRFAMQESGHAAQNLVLSAAAQGLCSNTLGNFLDDRAAQALQLPPHELPLYILPIGFDAAHGTDERSLAFQVAARDARTPRWLQWRLYTDQPKALLQVLEEQVLRPLREAGEVLFDWHLVKGDPKGQHVRLRLLPSLPELHGSVEQAVLTVLARVQADGLLREWGPGQYEPEQFLFGGPAGMDRVHALFALDSQLCRAAQRLPATKADLVSHLWTELLMRFVGLDAFEIFDVWSQVGLLRPSSAEVWQAQLTRMHDAALHIKQMSVPALRHRLTQLLPDSGQLVDQLALWAVEFMALANGGQLSRGPRQILSVCLIFHFNRMVYGAKEQMFLTQLRIKVNHPG